MPTPFPTPAQKSGKHPHFPASIPPLTPFPHPCSSPLCVSPPSSYSRGLCRAIRLGRAALPICSSWGGICVQRARDDAISLAEGGLQMPILHGKVAHLAYVNDNVPERLRGLTRNQLGSARASSSLVAHDLSFLFLFGYALRSSFPFLFGHPILFLLLLAPLPSGSWRLRRTPLSAERFCWLLKEKAPGARRLGQRETRAD